MKSSESVAFEGDGFRFSVVLKQTYPTLTFVFECLGIYGTWSTGIRKASLDDSLVGSKACPYRQFMPI